MSQTIYSTYALNHLEGFPRYLVPQSVEIDPTQLCNQDCVYCNSRDFRANSSDRASNEHYHELIERLASWHSFVPGSIGQVRTITFVGGGEPTLRKGFQNLVGQSVNTGILTSLVTNGSYLERLADLPSETISKMAWVGVDIDSGDFATYEKVRRSKQLNTFNKVKENVAWLAGLNPRVDIKALLHPMTISQRSLEATFEYAKEVGARMVYFRLALLDSGVIFDPPAHVESLIEAASQKFDIAVKTNKTRLVERKYTSCHALFMLPVFSADGNIYLCCENRGNSAYSLGSWSERDFRQIWNSEEHQRIFHLIDVKLCKPCRPDIHNARVEESMKAGDFYQPHFL